MKKILFVYPHNFLDRNMGTNNRVYSLAKYLKEQGCIIDLYACNKMLSKSFKSFEKMNSEKIIDNLFLYNFRKTLRYKKLQSLNILKKRNELEDWVTPSMRKQFKSIVKNEYDYVVMFYLYTAKLLDGIDDLKRKIYFMEDFLSVSQYTSGSIKDLGGPFSSEIKRLDYFDEIVCISNDEKLFFEKVVPSKKYYFIPHLLEEKHNETINKKKYDLLYIGFDNRFNIDGMKWFLNYVYPYLSKEIKILVVGKITNYISDEYDNITKIEYVQDLFELYHDSKISICPLLGGTGMKIKVVEAMSYGIPVVCTTRGVDGFPDKNENGCLIANEPAAFANHITRLIEDEKYYKDSCAKIKKYFNQYLSKELYLSILNNIFGLNLL